MNAFVQNQKRSYSSLLAEFAVHALIDEVNLTPKPALVDRRGNGAHHDLTLELMERSAKSLKPMFEAMAQVALEHGTVSQHLREAIGQIGRDGEAVMLMETQGINTHRGAIWALGLLVTATAMHSQKMNIKASEICQIAAEIACLEDRFIPQQQQSHGQYVQKKYVRIGEGSITYSIGHHRFIEMARAAGAVYKINEGTGGTVLINIDIFDEYMEQFREEAIPMKHPLFGPAKGE